MSIPSLHQRIIKLEAEIEKLNIAKGDLARLVQGLRLSYVANEIMKWRDITYEKQEELYLKIKATENNNIQIIYGNTAKLNEEVSKRQ